MFNNQFSLLIGGGRFAQQFFKNVSPKDASKNDN